MKNAIDILKNKAVYKGEENKKEIFTVDYLTVSKNLKKFNLKSKK